MSDHTETTVAQNADGWLDYDPAGFIAQESQFMSPEMQSMLDYVDMEIINWIPRPGDKLVGTLFDVTEVDSNFHKDRGGVVPLLIVRSPSGKFFGVRCYSTVLLKEVDLRLSKDRLHVGDLVAIKYIGKKAGGIGEAYDDWRFSSRPQPSDAS